MINFDDDFKDWAFQVYGCFDPIMRKSLRPRNKGSDTIFIFHTVWIIPDKSHVMAVDGRFSMHPIELDGPIIIAIVAISLSIVCFITLMLVDYFCNSNEKDNQSIIEIVDTG